MTPKQYHGSSYLRWAPFVIALGLCLAGCGEPGPSRETMDLGKDVYHRSGSCVTCHQAGGQGKPGLYPPLNRNPRVVGDDTDRLIKIVLHGMTGPLEVKGKPYNQIMGGQGQLLDAEETAAVITYVRNSWRNEAPSVTAEEVEAIKGAYPDRVQPWTTAELDGAADPVLNGTDPLAIDQSDPVAWGKVLYNGAAQCATCHQPNGEGVEGAYPPLAESPWVTGDHERLIKLSLHGVGGEMTILGNTYSNEMPGQGALLDDKQMAATLTYVRQAWGNDATPIYADQVAKLRELYADRHEPWPAEELAAVDNRSPLTNLRYRRLDLGDAFEGIELNTPEFEALPVLNEGLQESGFIELNKVEGRNDQKTPFAVVFEADLEVPQEDQYEFAIESNGSAVFVVDGQPLMGKTKIAKGRVNTSVLHLMSPGEHKVKVYYANPAKWRTLKISAKADSVPRTRWAMTPSPTNNIQLIDPAFLLVPAPQEPIVMRGRYEGQSNLGVAVGHPLRVNYAFDLSRSQLTRVWHGEFVNAAGLWVGRNDKHLPPAGTDILDLSTRPAFASLPAPDASWPEAIEANTSPEGFDFIGYRKSKGLPVFYSRFNQCVVSDHSIPTPGGPDEKPRLTRELTAYGAAEDETLHALLAVGQQITEVEPGTYVIDNQYRMVLGDTSTIPAVIEQDGQQLLVAPAAWESISIDLPEWVLKESDLLPQAAGFRAAWTLEYQWLD